MAKYDVQFKVKLVKEYLSGDSGYRLIADTYGVDISQLRYWVASYQHHGVSGLENKRATYSAEFKQQVLQRIDREGLSDRQAAAVYNIRSIGTIGQWRRQYNTGESGALKRPRLTKRLRRKNGRKSWLTCMRRMLTCVRRMPT